MKREAVSLLGLAALVSSAFVGHFRVKPNRVSEGSLLSIWRLGGGPEMWIGFAFAALAVGLVVLLVLTTRRLPETSTARTGSADTTAAGSTVGLLQGRLTLSAFMLPLLLALLGFGGQAALETAGHESGRAGPALGWWIAVFGAYLLYYDSRRRTRDSDEASARRSRYVPLALTGLLLAVTVFVPFEALGLVQEFSNRTGRFWEEFGAHLVLSGASVGGAVLIGVPLGMLAFRSQRAERPVFTITSGLQTIPSLALFGLMIAPLAFLSRQIPFLRALGIRGVGNAPAIIALTLYGLLPIVRNTYVGLKSIDRGVLEAGRGMGMSRSELLRMVQIPIALPIMLTGLRITAVQTVGNAAVAALIGARGLGNFVFQGLGQAAPDLIVLGALPIVALAVVVDRGMDALIRALRPGPGGKTR